jgi:O-antigen/teichoic acid export membrane protein
LGLDVISRGLLGGALVSSTVRVAGVLLGYGAHVVLSRLLGLHGYGTYVIALSWALVLTIPTRLGFDQSALRYATVYLESGQIGRFRGFMRVAILSVSLVAVGLGCVMVLVGSRVAAGANRETVVAAALIILPLALLGIMSVVMRTAGRIFASQFYDQVLRPALLIAMVGGLALAGMKLTVSSALIATALSAFGALAALGIHLRWLFASARTIPANYDAWKPWFTVSLPLLAITLAQELMNQLEVILLGYFADARQAGLFAAAWRLASLTPFALVALAIVSGPMVASAYHRRDFEALNRVAGLTARLGLAFSACASILLAIAGKPLLGIFGAEFKAAYPALLILLVGGLINAFTGVVAYLLTLTGRERHALWIFLGSLGLSLGLNVLLIPRLGFVGAAIASSSALGCWNLVMLVYVRRVLGIDASALGLSPRRAHLV